MSRAPQLRTLARKRWLQARKLEAIQFLGGKVASTHDPDQVPMRQAVVELPIARKEPKPERLTVEERNRQRATANRIAADYRRSQKRRKAEEKI
jgi:hypothetical protein